MLQVSVPLPPGAIVVPGRAIGRDAGGALNEEKESGARGQLAGAPTILILVMSAAGGGTSPRHLVAEASRKLGLLTFDGRAPEPGRNLRPSRA